MRRGAVAVRPVLTPSESAGLDRAAAERGLSVGSLMERAGEVKELDV